LHESQEKQARQYIKHSARYKPSKTRQGVNMIRSTDLNYNNVLTLARESGEAHEVRHLPGWRDIRKSTAIGLYHEGKISVQTAINNGAKLKDHLIAVESGKVSVQDLIAAGVDLHKIDKVRKERNTKAEAKASRPTATATKVIASVTIRNGQVVKTIEKAMIRKPTAQQVEVAIAVANSTARAKAKAAVDKIKERGGEVKLTDQEKIALLARINAKGVIAIR
jgi:hypothetical protein